jgi:glycosyltransferase involved in cell wall biosynthesis
MSTETTMNTADTGGTASTVSTLRDIFIVCNTIDELGGVQRWARSIADLLTERGHRVHLVGVFAVAPANRTATSAAGYSATVLHPNRYGARPRPALLSRIANPVAFLRHKRWQAVQHAGAARLAALLRTAEQPENAVVICAQVHAMEWVGLAVASGGAARLPVIAMSHESYAASMASSRGRRVKKYYATAARFVCLTAADAARWVHEGGMNNTDAIPNPLPLPANGGADPGARVVLGVGRLSQEKGFDLLLEAWAAASAGRPGWVLRLHGSGPERDALAAQADRLGITGSVDFAGQTDDVAAALVQGSVFAAPSRAEGFPMALLEAMACGLPCVAFDCAPGVTEIVRDGENGIVVPPGNTEAFAKALGGLMDAREEREGLGKAAVESVRRFAPEEIMAEWENLFNLVWR